MLEALTYDENGNVATSLDANENLTSFEYDERNLVTAELGELEATSRFVYDAMGDRVSATDPEDRVVAWTYDLRRRMASETRGEDETTTFGYDLNGNRTSKVRPEEGIWRWEWDPAHRARPRPRRHPARRQALHLRRPQSPDRRRCRRLLAE